MSDKTESPALLSPERLAEIEEDSNVTLYWIQGQRYPTDDMACRAVAAVTDLLADRAAFRQQVAAELHRMLIRMSGPIVRDGIEWPLTREEKEWAAHNERIKDAATRLGLTLSAPTS